MWMVINSYKAPGSWQCRVFQSVTDTSIRQLCVLRNISICVTRLYFRHVLKMWAWSHHECPVTSCVMWRHVVLTWRASTSLAGMQGLPLRSSITLSPLDNQLLNVNPSNNAAETIPVILYSICSTSFRLQLVVFDLANENCCSDDYLKYGELSWVVENGISHPVVENEFPTEELRQYLDVR